MGISFSSAMERQGLEGAREELRQIVPEGPSFIDMCKVCYEIVCARFNNFIADRNFLRKIRNILVKLFVRSALPLPRCCTTLISSFHIYKMIEEEFRSED
ncbi:unnamed protein product [Victoria cruziana]